jgi:hypothetical protein
MAMNEKRCTLPWGYAVTVLLGTPIPAFEHDSKRRKLKGMAMIRETQNSSIVFKNTDFK